MGRCVLAAAGSMAVGACAPVRESRDPALRAWDKPRLLAPLTPGVTTRAEVERRPGGPCEADARMLRLDQMRTHEGCSYNYLRYTERGCLSSPGSPIAIGCCRDGALLEAVRLDFVSDRAGRLRELRRVDGAL